MADLTEIVIQAFTTPEVVVQPGVGAPVIQAGGDRVVLVQPTTTEIIVQPAGIDTSTILPNIIAYQHTQAVAASTWIVNHNLGVRPVVAVLDAGYNEVEAQVNHVSLNQFQVNFSMPIAGFARCL